MPASSTTTITLHEVEALVRRWLDEAARHPADPAAKRLAGVLKDDNGLAFTVGFVDGVVRPEDLRVAARALRRLSTITPRFLPWPLRAAIRLGGLVAPLLPRVVVPIARRVLRRMVGHLVLDARPERLGPAIARLRAGGDRLNLNLLGEAVLGEEEAGRRLEGTKRFLARDDVDYVSVKVSSVVSQLSMWAFDEAVDDVVEKLLPLYELAASSPSPRFINLDMEEYRDLDLTIAVFQRLLDRPSLARLEAGIVLQAYLPDALGAMQRLNAWASARVEAGGAPIKIRLVKGANLAMEHVDAALHGWPVASYESKQDTDTNYKRVLDWALTPERTRAVRLGVAGHNLFDIAYAWLLAGERGVRDAIEFEMLLGMATGQAAAVSRDVGRLLLYTPVVDPAEFDVAIAYLVRRLEENASPENFMSAVFDLDRVPALFERERDRFARSLDALRQNDGVPAPKRTQNRLIETEAAFPPRQDGAPIAFENAPDTDPALAQNRRWGREILRRARSSSLGTETIEACRREEVDRVVELQLAVRRAAEPWAARPANERAALLDRAGAVLAARRGELIEVAVSEAGKTIAEADVEVSEAVDFAHYYAERARELDHFDGARFRPARLTVVTPPWNFPLAIPTGGVLAALAAGSGVILKPAPLARRCAAVIVEALHAAGIPDGVLALADVPENEAGRELVSSELVDRVILTGAYETAELFRSFRPDLPLLAETSGKNAIVVMPSADLDLAAADVVRSAFGHAGQKCSASSLVILVGSVARSKRFRRQLVDAARSLRVGEPWAPATQMGPLIEEASGKLLRGLTELAPGETWLLAPRQVAPRIWTPGIRDGVARGSDAHLTEYFGPVLGIMRARDLDEALELQNAVAYGLTAGLHSLDAEEIATWTSRVQAGNLYVNRGITGAIVRRQPFGGWKRSSVGPGAKAGGPNYLLGLGDWAAAPFPDSDAAPRHPALPGPVNELLVAAAGVLSDADAAWLRRAAEEDARAWAAEFGASRDVSGLGVERNLFRYVPSDTLVRAEEGAAPRDVARVLLAAVRAGGRIELSLAAPLPFSAPVSVVVESAESFANRLRSGGAARVRLVGGDAAALARATDGRADIAIWGHAVTGSPRVEFLPFVHEQALSITNHRFGNPVAYLG